MKPARISFGLAIASATLLVAGAAQAGIDAPPNTSVLSFGDDMVAAFVGSAEDNEDSGVTGQRVEVFASDQEPGVYVAGAAINPDGEGIVALIWFMQAPDKTKRKEDKLKVQQEANVVFTIATFASEADFDDGDTVCDADFILLDSCEAEAKVKQKDGLQGKFEVECKDVNAAIAAQRFFDEDQGDLDCDDGFPSEEELSALVNSFLDEKGKLEFKVKDDVGAVTDEALILD